MTTGTRFLSVPDAVAIVLGMVIGAGIFKTPSIVAASAGSAEGMFFAWIAGGAISLAGALCYAELASAYPGQGGEYGYVTRAFGPVPGFLFAWARMTVVQTGSIAMLAFLVGDYLVDTLRIPLPSPWIAAFIVFGLTLVNAAGIRQGTGVQWLLVVALMVGLFGIVAAGALSAEPLRQGGWRADFLPGKAMVFVLLTFGGWNEAAYLSAEVRDPRRNMVRVLVTSIAVITVLYLAVNLALLHALGLEQMARSEAVASDLMRRTLGEGGARLIAFLVVVAALSTINATMMTGARSAYALGRDFPVLGFLGRWKEAEGTPANALLLQGAIALLLVAAGSAMRSGFEAMVSYTAPVFWFFFLLTGLSLFVLRRREPARHRPFRVPFFPVLPLLFCLVCIAMLVSSLAFTGVGALAGAAVLLAGIPLFLWVRKGIPPGSGKENSP